MRFHTACLAAAALLLPSAAHAQEIWTGVYVHDIDVPTSLGYIEDGYDIELGWRGERIDALGFAGRPSPYVFGSANTSGNTNFVAAGLSWKFGETLYFRPGIGIVVHDGPLHPKNGHKDLGSRVLFEPELNIGVQLTERFAIEASWVHLSHAKLFSGQNPGMDTFGVRLAYKLR